MKVEIWSDVVCPWCYVGKRRFEAALSGFPHAGDVQVHWRSFELDPRAPTRREGPYAERLAAKYGMSVAQAQASVDHMVEVGRGAGIEFNFAGAQPGNTFDAHRLLHLAYDHGCQGALKDRLLAATFTEGAAIGDRRVLRQLAIDVGLDGDEVQGVLDTDRFAEEVRRDEHRAMALGINAVPFFLFDEKYGVAGAQSPTVFTQALEEVWNLTAPAGGNSVGEGTAGCQGDACAIPGP
jgi:predicted DsbA family dithiol-disulfide isomerase